MLNEQICGILVNFLIFVLLYAKILCLNTFNKKRKALYLPMQMLHHSIQWLVLWFIFVILPVWWSETGPSACSAASLVSFK